MAQVCQFVDSIDVAPTVLFDFNPAGPAVTLLRQGTSIGAAPLNQAYTSTLMVDGGVVGSSAYGLRTLTLALQLRGTVDAALTSLTQLNRELDKATNLLKWQPNGATNPVFFETFRSGPVNVDLSLGTTGTWNAVVTLQANPFALGLRQTLGPFTVNNDPAAASNGCFFDVTGVKGDAPTLPILVNTAAQRSSGFLGIRSGGTPANVPAFMQAESAAVLLSASNPGGGPDAAMSGSGTNNYLRTTWTTTTGGSPNPMFQFPAFSSAIDVRGLYRVIAVVRRSDATSDIVMNYHTNFSDDGATVTVGKSTSRQAVDLGILNLDPPPSRTGGLGTRLPVGDLYTLTIQAARPGGAGTVTLDFDYVMLLPADQASLTWQGLTADSAASDLMIDCRAGVAVGVDDGSDVFTGTGYAVHPTAVQVAGGFPSLQPGSTNRIYTLSTQAPSSTTRTTAKSVVDTWMVHCWPNYLNVRPPSL